MLKLFFDSILKINYGKSVVIFLNVKNIKYSFLQASLAPGLLTWTL